MADSVKIALVNVNYPSYSGPPVYMPVGLGYLAEKLLRQGIIYSFHDLSFESEENFLEETRREAPEYIGFSLLSLDVMKNHELIRRVRSTFPDITIIVGGPHISFVQAKVFEENPCIDFALVHEGEHSLIALLQNEKEGFDHIDGLIYKTPDGIIKSTRNRKFNCHLDKLPFPTYHGFPMDRYNGTVSIASSRGCPYSCTFCGAHLSAGKKWRARTAENIMEEIKYWYARGYRDFEFVDSNFFLSKQRVIDLCDLLAKENLNVRLSSSGMRAEDADETMILKLKRYGLRRVAVGIESANETILKKIRKGESLDQIHKGIRLLSRHDVNVVAFFIIGLPGERFSHVLNSFRFALTYSNIETAYFFNVNPLFETPLFKWAKRNHYLLFNSDKPGDVYQNIGGMSDTILMETPDFPVWQRKVAFWLSKRVSFAVRWRFRWRRLRQKLKNGLGILKRKDSMG